MSCYPGTQNADNIGIFNSKQTQTL